VSVLRVDTAARLASTGRRSDLAAAGLLQISRQHEASRAREHRQTRPPADDRGALRRLRIGQIAEVVLSQARGDRAQVCILEDVGLGVFGMQASQRISGRIAAMSTAYAANRRSSADIRADASAAEMPCRR